MKRIRLVAAVIAAIGTLCVTLLAPTPSSAADSISYTFRFVNGQTIGGVANDKTHFLPDAGGTSADNPTGMEVHLSCSDKFTGGWGDKDGPVQGVDTAWQISSYFIQKGNKTCGTPTPPPPPPDPPAIDIEKYVNGEDADNPTGPVINIGETAVFTYEVTNTGGIPLRNIEVTDSELGAIACPRTELDVDESMFCAEQTEVVTSEGQFTMKATVTGIGDVQTPGLPPGSASKGDAYRFTFVNGTTISRVGKKEEFFANAGGTSVTNPTGMKVHLSCSDRFVGGWGQKDGPVQGVDTAWQIASYSIGKVKDGRFELKCGDPFTITTEEEVMDMDPVYFIVPPPPADPKIDIEKFVNGRDADNPPGPTVPAGATARFVYVVRNIGEVPLQQIVAIDNVIGVLNCPRSELGVGDFMLCESTTMEAEPGQHFMESCVEGFNDGRRVEDCDPVYWEVPPPDDPKIDIEKFVEGQDADNPPGPTFRNGQDLEFTYVVTNTGDVPLARVQVQDNVVGPITCPRSSLGVGESMRCQSTFMEAEPGSNFMEACVQGFNAGRRVTDCDPVYYEVPPPPADPKIDIEKYVEGQDADNPPGPTFESGREVEFTYVVTNTGDVPLSNVEVGDSVVGAISCPRTTLGVGETMNCRPTTMPVEDGQNFMEACTSGTNGGREVSDCDPVYYRGKKDAPPPKAAVGDNVSFLDGRPAAGVRVNLFETVGGRRGRFLGLDVTDGNGTYGYQPGPGCYTVVFIAPSGYEYVGGNRFLERRTCLEPGEIDLSIDAVLRKA